jgi:hypothetical protein
MPRKRRSKSTNEKEKRKRNREEEGRREKREEEKQGEGSRAEQIEADREELTECWMFFNTFYFCFVIIGKEKEMVTRGW